MRKAVFLTALLLPLTTASAAPAPRSIGPVAAAQPSAKSCRDPGVTFAGEPMVAKRAQKLGELPPANHYLSVVRQVGGCPEPAIVRTGIRGR